MQAELKDWLTPKAVIAGTYAVVGIVGYCNLWKRYKKQCALIKNEMAGKYTWDDYKSAAKGIEGLVLNENESVKKMTSLLIFGSQNCAQYDLIKDESKIKAQTPTLGSLETTKVPFHSKLYRGFLVLEQERVTAVSHSDKFSVEIYPQPWLKKIGYAYGVAGLGVIAFCGLTK
jgi:hypothetical protein